MASVKLGKTGLETRRWSNGQIDVYYGGVKLGFMRYRQHLRQYAAFVITNDARCKVLIGLYNPADYKSYHAARKAAAEAIVVAHDKLLDGEPL